MADQDNLQFDRAEPAAGTESGTRACTACTKPLTSTYFEVNGHVLCEACRRGVEAEWNRGGSAGRFGRALGLGILAMIACSIVWYLVLKATDSQWGILAIVVGLVVVVLAVLVEFLHLDPRLGQAISLLVVTPVAFILFKRWTFRLR